MELILVPKVLQKLQEIFWLRSQPFEKGVVFSPLTDMSKAFDCVSHDRIIVKLEAYGFSLNALKLMYSYMTTRFQNVRINTKYSLWSEIISGVPQGYILVPLLFNIYLCDLFISNEGSTIANYADDNTLYALDKDINSVITKLENDSCNLFQWLSGLEANPRKSHLLLSVPDNKIAASINNNLIYNENNVDLLGITIDITLSFKQHVSNLCKKASNKIHALFRMHCFPGYLLL